MEKMPLNSSENGVEKKAEQFPSKEEIQSVFEKILKIKEYKERRLVLSDDGGVVVYEVETQEDNGESIGLNFQRAEYNYRDPSLPKTARHSASIHSTTFSGGLPTGGKCVANYLDGTWVYTT